jgi:hypothetical protein
MLDFIPHVDLRSYWMGYRNEFGPWYAASTLVAGVFAARWLGRAAPLSAFLAGLASTALSWLFIVRIPLALYLLHSNHLGGSFLASRFDSTHPVVWLTAMTLSMLLGGFDHALAHRVLFRRWPTRSVFWKLCLLQLLCLSLAGYRMHLFSLVHPPQD